MKKNWHLCFILLAATVLFLVVIATNRKFNQSKRRRLLGNAIQFRRIALVTFSFVVGDDSNDDDDNDDADDSNDDDDTDDTDDAGDGDDDDDDEDSNNDDDNDDGKYTMVIRFFS